MDGRPTRHAVSARMARWNKKHTLYYWCGRLWVSCRIVDRISLTICVLYTQYAAYTMTVWSMAAWRARRIAQASATGRSTKHSFLCGRILCVVRTAVEWLMKPLIFTRHLNTFAVIRSACRRDTTTQYVGYYYLRHNHVILNIKCYLLCPFILCVVL